MGRPSGKPHERGRRQRLIDGLRGNGFNAFVIRSQVEGKADHRVRLGPVVTRGEAVAMVESLRVHTGHKGQPRDVESRLAGYRALRIARQTSGMINEMSDAVTQRQGPPEPRLHRVAQRRSASGTRAGMVSDQTCSACG